MSESIAANNILNPQEVRTFVERCMEVKLPAFVWGPPGIGKSDVIMQIAESQERPVVDLRLLLLEPTDLRGIPYFDSKTSSMRWAPPCSLPQKDGELHNAILFLDELNSAAP